MILGYYDNNHAALQLYIWKEKKVEYIYSEKPLLH